MLMPIGSGVEKAETTSDVFNAQTGDEAQMGIESVLIRCVADRHTFILGTCTVDRYHMVNYSVLHDMGHGGQATGLKILF